MVHKDTWRKGIWARGYGVQRGGLELRCSPHRFPCPIYFVELALCVCGKSDTWLGGHGADGSFCPIGLMFLGSGGLVCSGEGLNYFIGTPCDLW